MNQNIFILESFLYSILFKINILIDHRLYIPYNPKIYSLKLLKKLSFYISYLSNIFAEAIKFIIVLYFVSFK